jgi:hypothetical protein
MTKSIGSVAYRDGQVVATLNGVDEWSVVVDGKPDAVMARALTARYRDAYRGPSNGHYGQLILNDLAGRTGGTMTIRDFPPAGPDEIP